MKTKFFSAILSAMMLTAASFSITASAEETVTYPVAETTESTGVSEQTEEVPAYEDDLMSMLESIAEETPEIYDSSAPDYYGDDYYDTDGNATLIQSEQIIYNTEEMQFIAVTTKDGHVFYVLINYSAENGEDNVYFLNKVDDYDLYALLYAGEEDEDGNQTVTPEEAAQAAENANGRVRTGTDSVKSDSADNAHDSEADPEEMVQTSAAPVNKNSIYLIVGIVALVGVGAAGFMFMKKKPKSKTASNEASEEYEDDDFNFYDNDENEDE